MASQTASSTRTIVVVDDDPAQLKLLFAGLTHLGHRVITVESGLGATNVVTKAEPDLVILDLNMPALDGRELCKLLRRHPRTQHVPIIFYSAQPAEELEAAASSCNASGYVCKGLPLATVAQQLLAYLPVAPSTVAPAAPRPTRGRRRSRRMPLLASCALSEATSGARLVGYLTNVSRGGAALYTTRELPVGAAVQLSVVGDDKTRTLTGNVRWSRRFESLFAVGIAFVLDGPARLVIDELVRALEVDDG